MPLGKRHLPRTLLIGRFLPTLALFAFASPALALEPKDVWLVVNKNVPESRQVADHYIAKRGVPKDQVIELDLPKGEDISRADYDAKLVSPLRDAIKDHKDKVKVLVTTYGVPLRVGQQQPNEDEKKALEKLRPELVELRKKRSELEKNKDADQKELANVRRQVDGLESRERRLTHAESQASVDSELMLLWWPHAPAGPVGGEVTLHAGERKLSQERAGGHSYRGSMVRAWTSRSGSWTTPSPRRRTG